MSEKEVEDALYMLLNCSLKDTKYTTQKEQFEVVKKYIAILEQENHKLKQWDKNKDTRNSRQRVEISRLLKENQQLKEQSKQRKKVIDKAIKQTKFIDEQLRKYVTPIPSKEVIDLLEILQKYKGDNNE